MRRRKSTRRRGFKSRRPVSKYNKRRGGKRRIRRYSINSRGGIRL